MDFSIEHETPAYSKGRGAGGHPQRAPEGRGSHLARPRSMIGHGARPGLGHPPAYREKPIFQPAGCQCAGRAKRGSAGAHSWGAAAFGRGGSALARTPGGASGPCRIAARQGGAASVERPQTLRAAHGPAVQRGACPGASGGALTPRVESERPASPTEAAWNTSHGWVENSPRKAGGQGFALTRPCN